MSNFSESDIQLVWENAEIVYEIHKDTWRKDIAGAWINRASYGEENAYGWRIDYLKPIAKRGSLEMKNLRPLHWHTSKIKNASTHSDQNSSKEDKDDNKMLHWKLKESKA